MPAYNPVHSTGAINAEDILSGTLSDARLSANVPLLDDNKNLTTAGLLLKTTDGNPFAAFAHDGDLGLTLTDGWGQTIDINSDNYGLMLNNMPLTLNGGGIYDQGFGYVYLSGGMLGALDATNLTNVPPPEGLSFGNHGSDFLGLSQQTDGDLYVGNGVDGVDIGNATQLLSSPNTLGPLDGSALTGYASALEVYGARYSTSAFNDFFGPYNADTSLPNDGTFSFGNGTLTGDGTNTFVTGAFGLGQFTVATVPDPAIQPGLAIYVIDAFPGPNAFFSDGSNWRDANRVVLAD